MRRFVGDTQGAAAPGGAAFSSPSEPPTLDKHLLDYLRVLVKRRWTAVSGLAIVMGLAGIHAYTATPIYESTVQLLIEHENQAEFSLRDATVQNRETTDYYNTQFTILQSRSVAKRAVETMKAWSNPELNGRGGSIEPTGMFQGVVRWATSTVRRLQGGSAESPETQTADRAAPEPSPTQTAGTEAGSTSGSRAEEAAIDAFLERVTVAPVESSRLVDVKFRASAPRFAADAANALARAYIDQNLEVRLASSKETNDWLTEQLTEQRRRIEASEQALQAYREKNDAVSLADSQNIIVQKLNDLNGMVTRAKADRIEREAAYRQVAGLQNDLASLDTLPAILSNPFLQQLKTNLSTLRAQESQLLQRLGDRHPDVVTVRATITESEAKLKQEVQNQVEAIKNDYSASQILEASLSDALESQKGEATSLNRKGIDYAVLEREVVTNREIFDALLARTRERNIASELKASEVRVIDVAQVPRTAIWPNRTQIMLYASFFGLLFGGALAFFFEYLNDRIKTPDEIKSYLGLPVLGLVPLNPGKHDPMKAPLIGSGTSPLFQEALRAVRTKIIFSAGDETRCLVITSTGPGEGKTAVACNLAIGLAMTGQRVLLLDVDMRRPRVHEVFDVPQEPGLSNLLAGTAETHEALREVSPSGLWTLPSGATPENPTELLSSPRFTRFFSALKDHFDWVIVDSPPVGAVTDACIVANRPSAVIFVVGSELTSRSAAAHAVEQLDAAGATFMGAVLNRVNLKRNAFYYSSYYRPAYDKYQQSTPR